MKMFAPCLLLLHLASLASSASIPNYGGALADHAPTPSQHFENRFALDTDKNYWLFWTADTDAKTIVFETHVKTHGYIGFGISPNGKMYPSDVVVGWVKDGQAYLNDYHTIGHSHPVVDQSQDWTLISGSEDNQWTVLKFKRKLDTCDKDDLPIGEDTIRVIYSYNDNDPSPYTTIGYHGATHRGAQSLMLLSTSLDEDDIQLPNDLIHFDLVKNNYQVPSADTTYSCSTHRLPPLDRKHHMVKMSPIITKGNELNVHHIIVYSCSPNQNVSSSMDNLNVDCQSKPRALWYCSVVFLAWAIGGTDYFYPEEAGVSMGTSLDPTFFIMETHYDNPNMRADIVDSSGLRLYLTPTLRKYDAGLLSLGMDVNRLQFVPPHEKEFVSKGVCLEKYLNQSLPSDGILVFATIQHAHLLGRGITTRLYRHGTEQRPISEDDHYDFNYQNIRSLRVKRKMLPGDALQVDCRMDSTGRTGVTYGGLSTKEEMCFSFIMYYPRMDLGTCFSSPTYDAINADPYAAVEAMSKWDFNDPSMRLRFKQIMNNSTSSHKALYLSNKYLTEIQHSPIYKQKYIKTRTCFGVNTTDVPPTQ